MDISHVAHAGATREGRGRAWRVTVVASKCPALWVRGATEITRISAHGPTQHNHTAPAGLRHRPAAEVAARHSHCIATALCGELVRIFRDKCAHAVDGTCERAFMPYIVLEKAHIVAKTCDRCTVGYQNAY